MGDTKVKNPELLKPIKVEEFNNDQIQRDADPAKCKPLEGIAGSDTDVRVLDKNGNGVIDEDDSFANIETGKLLSENEKLNFLHQMCGQYQPNKTKFVETPKAREIRKKYGAEISFQNGSVWMNEHLVLSTGESISSGGTFDTELDACHYNFGTVTLDVGRREGELKLVYTDATGDHVEYLDLKTGTLEEIG